MKCKDCSACKKGFFRSKPDAYVCTGVKEPFIVDNINIQCTEYKKYNDDMENKNMTVNIIKSDNIYDLEHKINELIKNRNDIVDIKYSSTKDGGIYSNIFSAMIIFK